MAEMEQIKISNEDDAMALLKRLVEGYELDPNIEVQFTQWPRFVIRVQGADFDGTIPTRIMPTLLELQREIHRVYCQATYGENNLRKLTQKDREQLELVVRVDKGSSFFETLLSDPLLKTLQDAASRMSPEQLTAVLIVSGVLLTSAFGWRRWLTYKTKEKELEQTVELSKLERDKLELISRAQELFPAAKAAAEGADNVREEFITKLRSNDQMSVADPSGVASPASVEINGDQAKELTTKPREKSVERMIEGEFIIQSADFSRADGFKVILMRSLDTYTFPATIPHGALQHDQVEALKDKSWEHQELTMTLLVKELHGGYRSAKVISVTDQTEED